MCYRRSPDGSFPADDYPHALSVTVSARTLHRLIVAFWVMSIGAGAVIWIGLIWFGLWFWSL